MASTTQPYRLRPGTWSDIPRAATLYTLAFRNDSLMDFLFPDRAQYPQDWCTVVQRMLQTRCWTLGWRFTVVEDASGEVQGFTWWNRGKAYESFWRRWLSPTWWFAPIVRLALSLRDTLFPLRARSDAHIFGPLIHKETEKFLTNQRRRDAHYFSIIAVNPDHQGKGLATMLIRDGLQRSDEVDAAAYLCRVANLREYYERFGFKEVGTSAVGKLAKWDGGQIMFRE